jgi:hypothetical protein
MADHAIGSHEEYGAWRAAHLRDRTSILVETEILMRPESGVVAPRLTTLDAQNAASRAVGNRHKV